MTKKTDQRNQLTTKQKRRCLTAASFRCRRALDQILLMILLKTLPIAGPRRAKMTITTTATRTRINAYSTRPCPFSCSLGANNMGFHLLSGGFGQLMPIELACLCTRFLRNLKPIIKVFSFPAIVLEIKKSRLVTHRIAESLEKMDIKAGQSPALISIFSIKLIPPSWRSGSGRRSGRPGRGRCRLQRSRPAVPSAP